MSKNMGVDDLEKEIILMEKELIFKRELLNECREKLNSEMLEHAQTKSTAQKYLNENNELQIQLNVCLSGTQKLEEENRKNREDLARLEVQLNAYLTERQQVLDNCYQAENENITLKTEVAELKEQLKGHLLIAEKFQKKYLRTEALVNEIISKQEILNTEQKQLEKICKEGLNFAEKLSEEAKFQIKYVQVAKMSQEKMENEIIRLMAVITELKAKTAESKNEKFEPDNLNYLEIWKCSQKELETRNKELQEINKQLLEELTFTKEQVEMLMKNY